MSDSDEIPGQAIYSDDSDYEQNKDSFISGRNSKSIDGSIVEQPFEIEELHRQQKKNHNESIYSKKKNYDEIKQIGNKEHSQIKSPLQEEKSTISHISVL